MLQKFIRYVGVKRLITPDSPWENGFIERFNGTLRDEFLNREEFYSLKEARILIENFRREYSINRPHSSLNYTAPLVFIKSCESKSASFHLVQQQGDRLNHGLRYRYYVCSNHIRYKNCLSEVKTYPVKELKQKVIDEIVRILRTPEIIMDIYKQAEDDITVSKDNIVSTLHDLADVWNYLYPTEQHKIARLLINEATVSEKGIRLRMIGEGVERLSQ